MVQKITAKLRGRPRKYQTEIALEQAMDVFWRAGFVGTSMDDLSEATQMNRPSLYHAFGDKRQIYLSLLDLYIANTGSAIAVALDPGGATPGAAQRGRERDREGGEEGDTHAERERAQAE